MCCVARAREQVKQARCCCDACNDHAERRALLGIVEEVGDEAKGVEVAHTLESSWLFHDVHGDSRWSVHHVPRAVVVPAHKRRAQAYVVRQDLKEERAMAVDSLPNLHMRRLQ